MKTRSQTRAEQALAAAVALVSRDNQNLGSHGPTPQQTSNPTAENSATHNSNSPTLSTLSRSPSVGPLFLESVQISPQASDRVHMDLHSRPATSLHVTDGDTLEKLARDMLRRKRKRDGFRRKRRDARVRLDERRQRLESLLYHLPTILDDLQASEPQNFERDRSIMQDREKLLDEGVRQIGSKIDAQDLEYDRLDDAYLDAILKIADRLDFVTEASDEVTREEQNLLEVPAVPDTALLEAMEQEYAELVRRREEQAEIVPPDITPAQEEKDQVNRLFRRLGELKYYRSELQKDDQVVDNNVEKYNAEIKEVIKALEGHGVVFDGESDVFEEYDDPNLASSDEDDGVDLSHELEHAVGGYQEQPEGCDVEAAAGEAQHAIISKRPPPPRDDPITGPTARLISKPAGFFYDQDPRARIIEWNAEMERTREKLQQEAKETLEKENTSEQVPRNQEPVDSRLEEQPMGSEQPEENLRDDTQPEQELGA